MSERVYNVLFLCTGNTARSVLAEGILNHLGKGRFRAFSAGSQPKGVVNPFAIEELRRAGLPADGFWSKNWDEFAKRARPPAEEARRARPSRAGVSERGARAARRRASAGAGARAAPRNPRPPRAGTASAGGPARAA